MGSALLFEACLLRGSRGRSHPPGPVVTCGHAGYPGLPVFCHWRCGCRQIGTWIGGGVCLVHTWEFDRPAEMTLYKNTPATVDQSPGWAQTRERLVFGYRRRPVLSTPDHCYLVWGQLLSSVGRQQEDHNRSNHEYNDSFAHGGSS